MPTSLAAAIDEIEAELSDRALAVAKLPRRAAMVMQYPSMGGKGY